VTDNCPAGSPRARHRRNASSTTASGRRRVITIAYSRREQGWPPHFDADARAFPRHSQLLSDVAPHHTPGRTGLPPSSSIFARGLRPDPVFRDARHHVRRAGGHRRGHDGADGCDWCSSARCLRVRLGRPRAWSARRCGRSAIVWYASLHLIQVYREAMAPLRPERERAVVGYQYISSRERPRVCLKTGGDRRKICGRTGRRPGRSTNACFERRRWPTTIPITSMW